MKNFFKGNNRFSGGRDFKRQDFGDRRSSDRPTSMHRTTCSECGNSCEVPFVPSGTKPVYCSKCFEQHRGGESKRFEGRSSAPRYNNYSENRNDSAGRVKEPDYKKQFESLNWKLDKLIKLLSPKIDNEKSAITLTEIKKETTEEVKPIKSVKLPVKKEKKKRIEHKKAKI